VFSNGIGTRAKDISKGIEAVPAVVGLQVTLARYATLVQLNHQQAVWSVYEFDMILL
jgi:hypothetical protein